MSADLLTNEATKSASLAADVTDGSCKLEFIEIVPHGRDTDDQCSAECDGADWTAEVKQEILPVVELQPDDVKLFCAVLINNNNNTRTIFIVLSS